MAAIWHYADITVSLIGKMQMPRTAPKTADLATIEARQKALLAELATLAEQAKAAELAARDAGRPILFAALARIKLPAMEKSDARTIASTIAKHGAQAVAHHLSRIPAD